MPAEFQKAMENTLIGPKNTFCLPDNLSIVSKISEADHFKLVTDSLKKINAGKKKVGHSRLILV